ncbi:MAG: hypothetical protein WBW33_20485 [Bryobacteraceae bacterium]
MKIFWSWQSDTPGKTGRYFVREVLDEVLKELKQDPEVQEPSEREDVEGLHIDHDIKGTTGSPNLVDTIINKIDASAVFIADITCVGQVFGTVQEGVPNKKLINSNVGIELGYALKSLTDSKVVLVFNQHYGSHPDVPFDLRHKGGAITFNLAPEAAKSAIKAEEGLLKSKFLNALRPLLIQAKKTARPPFPETSATYCKAAYFDKGEFIAEWGEEQYQERLEYSYEDSRLIYLRLIPTEALSGNLAISDLEKEILSAPLLGNIHGLALTVQNRFGVIKWHPGSHPKSGPAKIHASTQLFRNGEIWSIETLPLETKATVEHALGLKLKCPFIPYLSFEQRYATAIPAFLRFSTEHLGFGGPWQLVCGMSGIQQVFITPYDRRGGYRQFGPFYGNEVESRSVVTGEERSYQAALLTFFEKVWNAAGENRPQGLYNFPPDSSKAPKLAGG